jgi:hypothetical protein
MHFLGEQETLVETYSSNDGGATWSLSHLPRLREALAGKEMIVAGDPWVAYAPDGMVHASIIASMSRDHAWGRLPLLFYSSRNGGLSWQEPAVVGPFFDRVAFIVSSGNDRKEIFAAGMAVPDPSGPTAVGVLRSLDDGATFERVLIYPGNLGHNGLNPVVAPDGALVVPYVDFPGRIREQFELRRRLMRTSRIFVVASKDGGRTFGLPRFVADIPRFDMGFPMLAVDSSSGAHRGRLYLAWNGESAELRNVTIGRSDDAGETWQATSVKASGAGPAYFSSLAVSPQGIVGLAWIQHESQEGNPRCWRTYFAASSDGGVTFSVPEVVSGARPSRPDTQLKGHLRERGGDYMGLAAGADGTFHVAWPDGRDRTLQISTTAIQVRVE